MPATRRRFLRGTSALGVSLGLGEWAALLPPDDQLPRPLRAALDNLDTQIRKIHEEAVLAA